MCCILCSIESGRPRWVHLCQDGQSHAVCSVPGANFLGLVVMCLQNGQHINHRSHGGIYIYMCKNIYIYMKNIWYVYGQYVHICIDEDFDVHIFPQRGVAKMMWVVASWAPDGRNGIRGGKHLPIQPWQHFPPPLMRRGKKPIFCRRRGKNKGKKRKTRKSLKMRETRVDEIF